MQKSHVKSHIWTFTCEIPEFINMSHVKFHSWNFTCGNMSHVKFHMWNFTCEISHVKFQLWNFTCEISHVKNMSHGKHMGFEIHMCYWNFTCESHVNHMGNTSQFSVRDRWPYLKLLYHFRIALPEAHQRIELPSMKWFFHIFQLCTCHPFTIIPDFLVRSENICL